MKVKDLVKQTEHARVPKHTGFLRGNQDVRFLDREMVEQMEEFICVADDDNGRVLGRVSRRLLLYLIEKQKSNYFEQILSRITDGVLAIDENGRIFYANAAYSRLFSVPLYRMIGRRIQDMEPGSPLGQVLRGQTPVSSGKRLIPSVGKYVITSVYPMWEDGCFLGAVSIYKDVTALHKLDRELRRMSGIVHEYSRQIYSSGIMRDLGLLTRDRSYRTMVEQAVAASKTDVPILVRGESGSGKREMAKFLYRCSERRDSPFITVNCAAVPDSLMEEELFGCEENMGNGGKKGKIELADGGTLFLDSVGDLSLPMQRRILQLLETGEMEKPGNPKKIPVDVRVIAATKMPLEKMTEEGSFHAELFSRLNMAALTIPPLRKRREDILPLANRFLGEYNGKHHSNVSLSADVYQNILEYGWPGNITELRSYVERAVILLGSGWQGALPTPAEAEERARREAFVRPVKGTLAEQVKDFERQVILSELEGNGWNRSLAMEKLGLSRRTFFRKCAELGISEPEAEKKDRKTEGMV